MSKNDARKHDHKTLEAIRIHAVEQVQAGEGPGVVIGVLGFSRACIYNWLAAYRAGGWHALHAKALLGRSRKITGPQMKSSLRRQKPGALHDDVYILMY